MSVTDALIIGAGVGSPGESRVPAGLGGLCSARAWGFFGDLAWFSFLR
jgi:hypothetical protein